MSTADDPFGASAAMQVLAKPQPVYLPPLPVKRASETLDAAISTLKAAAMSQWRSALAQQYRDELDDLVWKVTNLRDRADDAARSYDYLRSVAAAEGH